MRRIIRAVRILGYLKNPIPQKDMGRKLLNEVGAVGRKLHAELMNEAWHIFNSSFYIFLPKSVKLWDDDSPQIKAAW